MCLQDPPGVPLYTMTGSMCKGGVTLPVLRCARGTTSLESFHLHLARYRDPLINMIIHLMSFRFIPGTSASAVHYQAYLLEGVTRWNQARALEAIQQQQPQVLRTFNLRLADKVFILYLVWYTNIKLVCLLIHCRSTMPVRDCLEIRSCQAPAQYTGEQFGIQYLYKQSLPELSPNNSDDAEEEEDKVDEDEGLGDESLIFPPSSVSEDFSTFSSVVENNEVYYTCTDVCDGGLSSCVTYVLGFSRESYR